MSVVYLEDPKEGEFRQRKVKDMNRLNHHWQFLLLKSGVWRLPFYNWTELHLKYQEISKVQSAPAP